MSPRSALLVTLSLLVPGCWWTPASPDAGEAPDAGVAVDGGPIFASDGAVEAPRGFVHREGRRIVDGDGAPLPLRCVNVDGWLLPVPYLVSDAGNALLISPSEFAGRLDDVVGEAEAEAFWERYRDTFITEADFARIAALGFDCVRLVIYHRAITHTEGSALELDETRLARVDAAIGWARRRGLHVVLDLHSAPGGQNVAATVADLPSGQTTPELWTGPRAAANRDATVALWGALAERYHAETTIAAYDLLNEPALPEGVEGSLLVHFYERVVAAVRAVDVNHMLFIEGDGFAHDFSMFASPLDDNMAYEFHAYALTPFSEWTTPETADLQPYLDLRTAHDRPIWLGEFGEGTESWISQMTRLMDANDVGWALFPWKRKQTWFFNPVLQRIPDMHDWYRLAAYLAQPADGTVPIPTRTQADTGMAELLRSVRLDQCLQSDALIDAILAD